MLAIFVKFSTEKILVSNLHMENEFTRLITTRTSAIVQEKETPVAWAQKYPFPAEEQMETSGFERIIVKADDVKKKVTSAFEKKITDRATENLMGYGWFVEHGRMLEDEVGWAIMNPSMNVLKLSDGYLTFASRPADLTEVIASVKQLSEFAAEHHAKLIFVQAPCKNNKYGDTELRKYQDASNENADQMVNGLRDAGVDTIDLRDTVFHVPEEDYHAQFYRTDHHWTLPSGLHAAKYLATTLHDSYGLETDISRLDDEDYIWHVKKAWFLGSQGKRVTLARTEPDDFVWAEPKFMTKVHFEMPSLNKDVTGDFSILFNSGELQERNLYHRSAYHMCLYGDQAFARIDNLMMEQAPEQKVLAFTDSYGDSMIPFLAMGVKHIVKIDLRHFTGSVHSLIEQEQPDVIVILRTASYDEKIDWKSHTDLFDFR